MRIYDYIHLYSPEKHQQQFVGDEKRTQWHHWGKERGADRPGWHPPGGWHQKEKNLGANLQRIVDKWGRTGKKCAGWHPSEEWHPSEFNKSDGDEQKRSSVFFSEKIGVTPSVAAPDDTHPSDATERTWTKRTEPNHAWKRNSTSLQASLDLKPLIRHLAYLYNNNYI